MKVSITDLASELGVAPSTISRALRREPGVSAELAAKIASLATKRGYALPQRLKQSFKSKHEKTICIAFAVGRSTEAFLSMGDLFYWRIFTELQKAASMRGAHVTFVQIEDNILANGNLHVVEERIADAVIAHSGQTDLILKLASHAPLVLLNNEITERPIDSVVTNFAASIALQLNHLRGLGHKKIAVFRPYGLDKNLKPVPMWADRKFLSWLPVEAPRFGIDISENAFEQWSFPPSGEAACIHSFVEAFIQETVRPTAILTYDLYAPPLIEALARHGLSVPEDVSILGADDDTHGRPCTLPLTSVPWNFSALAHEAIHLLLERIEHPMGERKTIKIAPTLVVRSSTAPAKTSQASPEAFQTFSQPLSSNTL